MGIGKHGVYLSHEKREEQETNVTDKAITKYDTYLKNPLLTWLGEDLFPLLVMKKSAQYNHVGMKATSLVIIPKPSLPQISVIGGLHPIRRSGLHLENTTDPSVFHSNQFTTTVSGRGQCDRDVFFGSLDSSHDVQRG